MEYHLILVLQSPNCFSSTLVPEMQLREGRHISVGFQVLRKYFPCHWCLFPCSHGDSY